jgi:hypothetical protein
MKIISILGVAGLLVLTTPTVAQAGVEVARLKPPPPYVVTESNPATVTARFDAPLRPRIEEVCFDMAFRGDLLDPGEAIQIGWFPAPGGGQQAIGVLNNTSEPISRVSLCETDPGVKNSFLDGIQELVLFMGGAGSVRISLLKVTAFVAESR